MSGWATPHLYKRKLTSSIKEKASYFHKYFLHGIWKITSNINFFSGREALAILLRIAEGAEVEN